MRAAFVHIVFPGLVHARIKASSVNFSLIPLLKSNNAIFRQYAAIAKLHRKMLQAVFGTVIITKIS